MPSSQGKASKKVWYQCSSIQVLEEMADKCSLRYRECLELLEYPLDHDTNEADISKSGPDAAAAMSGKALTIDT